MYYLGSGSGSGSPPNSAINHPLCDFAGDGFDQPISDNSVSTTCIGTADQDWSAADAITVEVDTGLDRTGVCGDGMLGIQQRVIPRQRNSIKNNIKAIKSGIKSATSWIPFFRNSSQTNNNKNCNYSSVNGNNCNNNKLLGINGEINEIISI